MGDREEVNLAQIITNTFSMHAKVSDFESQENHCLEVETSGIDTLSCLAFTTFEKT